MPTQNRSSLFRGPVSGPGLALALITFVTDQVHKYWMIHVYEIGKRGRVEITSFFDLVMVWNPGVSYGLFRQDSDLGRYALAGFAFVVSIGLVIWLARQSNLLASISLGLIIGGALANALDRLHYGAVADFFSLHAWGFNWYVFNIADAAIVAGVAGLLYEAFFGYPDQVSEP